MKIGFWEIVIIAVVALLVIGPDKLPEYMRSLGKGLVQLRNATSSITDDLQKEVVEPLQEVAKPLKDAVEPIAETAVEVNNKVNGVNKTINDLKNPMKAAKNHVAKKVNEQQDIQSESWICPQCGNTATGKFCSECGSAKHLEQPEVLQEDNTGKEEIA